MRLDVGVLLAATLCSGAPSLIRAEENSDLDRIPKAVQDNGSQQVPREIIEAPDPQRTQRQRFHLEDALTFASLRNGLVVPFPPPVPFTWQNRTSLNAANRWNLSENLTAHLSDRFNVVEQSNIDHSSRQTFRNDFREGYLAWEPMTQRYLEAGRVNVRNGIALGFNPTDFFKTRTFVDQASQDPSVTRQNRLGTLMGRGQAIWDGGSASLVIAPKLYSPTPLSRGADPSLDLKLDWTNAANRVLFSSSYNIADLSPQALVYYESGNIKFGLNISRQMSQGIVAYAEWAGGKQANLISQAISYGKLTGTLPANAPTLPPTDLRDRFRNDLAVGASWASAAKITLNIEYHLHEAGFSRQDWRNWFAIGGTNSNSPSITGELWYIRAFANDQQQPLTRHQIFLRANWTDAFIANLELSAFTFLNLYDGSQLAQLSASYYLSDAWTIRGYVTANIGKGNSERGSFPQAASAIFQVVRYF